MASKPNVLFIVVDDLRPELGCYGQEHVHSPNIDRLAGEGIRFEKAYCQQAICGPSRASMLTGRRPDNLGVTDNATPFRLVTPEAVTLPQHFAASGYQTLRIGKVFHDGQDDPDSWTVNPAEVKPSVPEALLGYQDPETKQNLEEPHRAIQAEYGTEFLYSLGAGPVGEGVDVPDNYYSDGQTADQAVQTMASLGEQPFFMAVGFKKPHLPFIAPKKYWDLYDPDSLPLTRHREPPQAAPAHALHASFETRTRQGVPKEGPIDETLAKHLVHGYLAGVSYTDAQVGRVLDALQSRGLRENTIVVLCADHGWHLGDQGLWGKATCYEAATRVPLIISAPGIGKPGTSTSSLVELVDLYPTLCGLAGLSVSSELDGVNLVPAIEHPGLNMKQAAFSQFPCPALREWAAAPLSRAMRNTFFGSLISEKEARISEENGGLFDRETFEKFVVGYAMRTSRYRLVRWIDTRKENERPLAVELYDHKHDPEETMNIASAPEAAALIETLSGSWLEQVA